MSIYNKNNLLIHEIASKDEGRPELTGVLFKKNRAVATDGYVLIEVKNNENFANPNEYPALPNKRSIMTNFSKKGYLLPAKSVKKALSNLNESENDRLEILNNCIFLNTRDENINEIATTDLENTNIVSTKSIDGEYPDTQKVIPQTDKGYSKTILDIRKLKQVIDVISKMDLPDFKTIELLTPEYDKDKPTIIKTTTTKEQKITGIIMPVKE
jgi:DNA polymerase III sliding clamp (beta) subunit (PCNA family)